MVDNFDVRENEMLPYSYNTTTTTTNSVANIEQQGQIQEEQVINFNHVLHRVKGG